MVFRCFYSIDFQTMIRCEGGALVSLKTIQIYRATIPHDLFRDQTLCYVLSLIS